MENGGDNFVKTNLTDEYQGNLKSYVWNYTNENSDSGLGTKSSTTGNIYGIYDFGGCLADYTSAYVWGSGAQANTNAKRYGYVFANGTPTYLATPYLTEANAERTDFDSAYPSMKKVFGDSIWELSSALGAKNAWFGEGLDQDSSADRPFTPRGGFWQSAGILGLVRFECRLWFWFCSIQCWFPRGSCGRVDTGTELLSINKYIKNMSYFVKK